MQQYDREFMQYVSLKTAGAVIPSVAPYSYFESWYQFLLNQWKHEVKKSEDMIPIGNRTAELLKGTVSKDVFKKGLNGIFLWQLMVHREQIDGLLTEEERIKKSVQILNNPAERNHFLEESKNLGDQFGDISPGSYQLVDLTIPGGKKRT